jgi:hypothetical protein
VLVLSSVAVLTASLSAVPASAAERYQVSLTRKGSNFYKIDGQRMWVQTRYCYTYGYGEDAALSATDVVFLGAGDKCDVRRVLREMDVSPGTYKIRLSHEADDLYSSLDGTFVRTSMCLHLGIGEEALVRIDPGGTGTVLFDRGENRCIVEAVLSQMRL